MVYDKRAWIICRTVRYDATRENVFLEAGLGSRLLLWLSLSEFVSFSRVPDFFSRWLYKIDGGRDEILAVDIYRCDEDDFQKKKKEERLHVILVDGRIVKFRTSYEILDYFEEFGAIGIDSEITSQTTVGNNSDLN